MHSKEAAKARRAGFSLVELLVATTILLVIVVLASMVFQQANGAFLSGSRRVKMHSAMRTISGAVMHDLAFLVDSKDFPGAPENEFSSKSIRFIASGGESAVVEPDENSGEDVVVFRPYRCITYTRSGESGGYVLKRLEEPLVLENKQWVTKPAAGAASGGIPLNDPVSDPLRYAEFSMVWPDGQEDGTVPLRVDIHLEKKTSGSSTYASAHSAGPDRKWNSDDDLWAGEPAF